MDVCAGREVPGAMDAIAKSLAGLARTPHVLSSGLGSGGGRERPPTLPAALLLMAMGDSLPALTYVEWLKSLGFQGIEVGGVPSDSLVRAVHGLGMAVYVWTINDERRLRRLIELGVDGIETDVPALAAELVRILKP